jgi:hypothetical protein
VEIWPVTFASIRLFIFFFEQGRVPKDPDAALIYSGGVTNYREDLLKIRNYKHILRRCKKDPTTNQQKAIESITTLLASELADAASNLVAGDETTWDEAAEERHAAGAENGPPFTHIGREVRSELTPAIDPGISRARQSSERPPFGHKSRRLAGLMPTRSRRGCAPEKCSS